MSVNTEKCQSFNITTYKSMLIRSYSLQCFSEYNIFFTKVSMVAQG